MRKPLALLALALTGTASLPVLAEEGAVTWFDPTCRYFVLQLPEGSEGFGLYEWKAGPEPKEGMIIAGDILGGPELKVTEKASGQEMSVVHWGDAKKQEVLVRHSPDWCKSKRKRR
ncbi:MAG TPA: hypothetical protein VFU53_11165 [Burkholderiales bacterium]|nr:hypothetical protein [Burkholderiales bacterium]